MSVVESAINKHRGAQAPTAKPVALAQGEIRGDSQAAQATAAAGRQIVFNRGALQAEGLLSASVQPRHLAAQYRRIKRPLLAGALGRGAEVLPAGHLIMVASALPGEGKSFTTVNLALSMAMDKELSVVLVDADVAKPHISNAFGVQSEPGLTDALQDSTLNVESLIIATDIPGLSLLPAGRHVETANELLASSRMQQLVGGLSRSDGRRIILFDSPPLLLTNESRVLSDVVGQVVLVVRAGVTSRRAVSDALAAVAEGKPVGLVLNQANQDGENYGYGEYGSYGSPASS